MTPLPGDKVNVQGVVIGYNVGGELEIDFGHAYGSPHGRLWVSSEAVSPVEPFGIRLRRRISRWLNRLALHLSPDRPKASRA